MPEGAGKTALMPRLHYRGLANALSRLPLTATVADLTALLGSYLADDPEHWAALLARLDRLAPEAEWLAGAFEVAEALRQENPRFVSGMWLEWVTEGR